MMIKCQKCGFENQMGSIFCRDCGEKLDMDAIDPNKLQKDVNKEKNLKLAKKRIKGLISGAITLLVIAAFIFIIAWRKKDINPKYSLESVEETQEEVAGAETEDGANGGASKSQAKNAPKQLTEAEQAAQKFNAVVQGKTVGRVTYSYPEINYMFRDNVVRDIYEKDPFAKPIAVEIAFDEKNQRPIFYMWLKLKSATLLYTIHGDITFHAAEPDHVDDTLIPISLKVKRLDIGLLPIHLSTHTFLNGFTPMLDNDAMRSFFRRAETVEFTADGMTVEFAKGGPVQTGEPQASSPAPAPSSSTPGANVARKIPAVAGVEQKNADRNQQIQNAAKAPSSSKTSTAKSSKTPAKSEEQIALEEERKRKAEEYRQQKKEQEEERKRKAAEEAERKKQEREAEKQRQKEENDRRNEERRREREERRNNNYNNNSRSSRSSRNNRW